jgi:hypothetical protein
MSANENKPGGEVILYQTEDLQTRVQVRWTDKRPGCL